MRPGSGTVVDSSVLLDVFTDDPRWGAWSQAHLTEAAQRGALVLNAVVLAEIAAGAFLAGHAHAAYRRAGGKRQAVLPDFLIGAHAAVTARPLLTRNPRRGVGTHIPGARLIAPTVEP